MQQALLRDGPVELLQAAVGEELTQVDAVVHEEAHKVGLVVDQRVHHHLLQVARLGERKRRAKERELLPGGCC